MNKHEYGALVDRPWQRKT